MRLIDISKDAKLVITSIEKFGNEPEHNFNYFLNNEETGTKNAVISLNNGKFVLANFDKHGLNLFFSGLIGPKNEQAKMLLDFCNYCFNEQKTKKVIAEVNEEVYNEFKLNIPEDISIKSLDYLF